MNDAISRQAVLENAFKIYTHECGLVEVVGVATIKELPSVKPQEPTSEQVEEYCRKRCLTLVSNEFMAHIIADSGESIRTVPSAEPTGHWIDIMVGDMPAQACDRCNTFYPLAYTGGGHKYCPNCGAKMIEPQEGEDKE